MNMNQEIKPLTALLIIAAFIAILAGKFWANGEQKSVRGFSYMQHHPNGDAYIMLDHQLFGFNDQGQFTNNIDLSRFGVDKSIVTDFAFFSNGDILLRKSIVQRNFVYNLQRYFRYTSQEPVFGENKDIGLLRCHPENFSCTPFTQTALNLNDSFALSIDQQTNRVFLSESSHHTIYMFSEKGELLSSADDFKFPNQLIYQDHKLYVADTNHHQLAVLNVTENAIEEKIEYMDTRGGSVRELGETWPESILLLPEQRWVINANNDMGHGGIYVFDHKGQYLKRLQQPEGSDMFALLQLGSSVLVTDYFNNSIYKFDLNGARQANFEPAEMQPLLADLTQRRDFYKRLDWFFSGLFVFAFLAGFAYAIWQQRNAGNSVPIPKIIEETLTIDLNDTSIDWFKLRFWYKLWAFVLPLIVIVITIVLGIKAVELSSLLWVGSFVYAVLTVTWLLSIKEMKLGIKDDFIIVAPVIGKPVQCKQAHILYSGNLIMLGKTVLNITQLSQTFIEEDIEQKLYPMIKGGTEIQRGQMNSLLLKQRRIVVLLALLALILAACFLYFVSVQQ
jgi:hypothetical protein